MSLTLNNWCSGSISLHRFAFGIAPKIWHIKRPKFAMYDPNYMYTVQNGEWVCAVYNSTLCISNHDFMFQDIKYTAENNLEETYIKLSELRPLKIIL